MLDMAADARHSEKITKESIFHYIYGMFHNLSYRKKYAENLKRSFPAFPFCEDFFCLGAAEAGVNGEGVKAPTRIPFSGLQAGLATLFDRDAQILARVARRRQAELGIPMPEVVKKTVDAWIRLVIGPGIAIEGEGIQLARPISAPANIFPARPEVPFEPKTPTATALPGDLPAGLATPSVS
jgi:hypothetical protein